MASPMFGRRRVLRGLGAAVVLGAGSAMLATCGGTAAVATGTATGSAAAATAATTASSAATTDLLGFILGQASSARANTLQAAQSATRVLEVIWETAGAPNKLSLARIIALDARGNLFVLDNGNNRVQKFDKDGTFLTMWGGTGAGDGQFIVYCPTRDCPPACTGGNCLHLPGGIAADGQGNVYVADYTGRVQKFDGNGKLLARWGGKGSGPGQFDTPSGVAVDAQGNVFVSDNRLNRVQRFDHDGTYVTAWGSTGTEDGQLDGAGSIALDAQGNVYVADYTNDRVQKFDHTGRFLMKFGGHGIGDGDMLGPQGVAIDSQSNIWVLENPGHRIQEFDSHGHYLNQWGAQGTAKGRFNYPGGLAVSNEGDLYVTDLPDGAVPDSSRIQKLRPR